MNLKIVFTSAAELYITGPDLITLNINPLIFPSPPVTNVQSQAECEAAQDVAVLLNRMTVGFSLGFKSARFFKLYCLVLTDLQLLMHWPLQAEICKRKSGCFLL